MKYKYTDYIINGNVVDVNSIISENKYIKIITIFAFIYERYFFIR